MGKGYYKKLSDRHHFSDFWHNAKSWRENKKIGIREERCKLKREAEKERNETGTQ